MTAEPEKLSEQEYASLLRESMYDWGNPDNHVKSTVIVPELRNLWERLPGFLFHVDYEIFFQIDGACDFYFPHRKMILRPGDILVVPPGMPHSESAFSLQGKKFRNLVLSLGEKWAAVHLAECNLELDQPATPHPIHRETLKSKSVLYHQMASYVVQSRSDFTPRGQQLRLDLLRTLCRVVLYDLGEYQQEELDNAHLHYKVRQVLAILWGCDYANVPGVAELSRQISCSPNYLSWLFHRETGETLKAHISRCRMEYAKRLLETTVCGIAEVAWSCGFQDAAYFARLFQRYCGCKPNEYRRKL